MNHFSDSRQHLLAELRRIDLLLRIQFARVRSAEVEGEELKGLYVSEQEVQDFLRRTAGLPDWAEADAPVSQEESRRLMEELSNDIAQRKAASQQRGVRLRLEMLADVFGLTSVDFNTILVCLAPEIDLRYERVFGYLQDDITKKRPTLDLVLNLLCETLDQKLQHRARFSHDAPLLKNQLLMLFDDPSVPNPPLLAKTVKLDDRVVEYLLDSNTIDRRLASSTRIAEPGTEWSDLAYPPQLTERLQRLSAVTSADDVPAVIYLQGPYGVGKLATAEVISREKGLQLLVVRLEELIAEDRSNFASLVSFVLREALLQEAAVYWEGFDLLLADDRKMDLMAFVRLLSNFQGLTFLAGNTAWEPINSWRQLQFSRVELPTPSFSQTAQLWREALSNRRDADHLASELANKFQLSGGQINDAVRNAVTRSKWWEAKPRLTQHELAIACRLLSNRKLASLAQRIVPHYRWEDIVLPAECLTQLREICGTVRHRKTVYDDWGFDRKLAMGKGLNILFAGPSGTGKTMAADVIAGELGLELYKIDLSTVVSKYIGETEKNLARIFSEAETSNAILFFDEADALFGKRSEVRDAHDRYANIEISYLLQRMEQYRGVVILATNLPTNMDEAFVRRMHFSVEFPFPDETFRRRIWEQIWPKQTPRCTTVDLDFMAQQVEVAGGNIRNIALAAAFLAANDGGFGHHGSLGPRHTPRVSENGESHCR